MARRSQRNGLLGRIPPVEAGWLEMTPLEACAEEYRDARERHREARDTLRAAVREALTQGMTEVEAARIAGVTRMTIRSWRRP